jgi:selenocysteine lyase/cysteine desulfurase
MSLVFDASVAAFGKAMESYAAKELGAAGRRRVSPHSYNDEHDLERLQRLLGSIAG